MHQWTLFSLALIVSVLWGIHAVVQKFHLDVLPPETVLVAMTIVYGIAGAIFLYFHRSVVFESARTRKKQIGIIMLAALVFSFIPTILYMYALKHMNSYIVSALVSTSPLITMAFGAYFLQENVTAMDMVGVLLITLGIVLIAMKTH